MWHRCGRDADNETPVRVSLLRGAAAARAGHVTAEAFPRCSGSSPSDCNPRVPVCLWVQLSRLRVPDTCPQVGILTHEELECVVRKEFNPVRVQFSGGEPVWTRDVLNLGVSPQVRLPHEMCPS